MLTAMPQMMQISHKPKVAPATLSAATHPVPKKSSGLCQEIQLHIAR